MNKKLVALLALAAMTVIGVTTVMAQPVQHSTVLTGKVASVVPVGTVVKEGDTLITVETLAGPMAGSKATVQGTVTATSVAAGMDVQRGQVVATIESK